MLALLTPTATRNTQPEAGQPHPRETAMHPTIHHEIAKARIADWHRQAQRDTLALAARQARRARSDQSRYPAPARRVAAARRVLALLRPRST